MRFSPFFKIVLLEQEAKDCTLLPVVVHLWSIDFSSKS